MRHLIRDYECRRTQRRLSPYLDDELSRRQRRSLERHVQRCPRCQQMLSTLSRAVEGLHRLKGRRV